jgi:hypothetical protein
MNTFMSSRTSPRLKSGAPLCSALLALVLAGWFANPLRATGSGQAFATPEAAVAALSAAVSATNRAVLATLFGSAVEQLVNPDEVQGAAELAEFTAAFNTGHQLRRVGQDRAVLEIGPEHWPFPIPLVKLADSWRFDTAAGLEEILNRRIGRNELDVLRVLRAYVEAQRDYASRDRDGDEVLEFAQRLASSPGLTDGLYWPTELNGEISPLGPLVAYAQGEGYTRSKAAEEGPQPFHGYFFKILARQGKSRPAANTITSSTAT